MRVLAIAELTDDWMQAVKEWQGLNERLAERIDGERARRRSASNTCCIRR